MLLGLVLGLSMFAAGSRLGGGLTVEGTALRDCTAGDQAWNYDEPGQPPPRLLDAGVQDSEDESDDDRTHYADVTDGLQELLGQTVGRVAFCERRQGLAERVGQGHGARGPPAA
jgi:hypothetical protein